MILPSLNASNCGDTVKDSETILSGNEIATRKTSEYSAIRSQGTLKGVQGSSTKRSSLSLSGMAKLSRMGRFFVLVRSTGFLVWILYASVVQAHVSEVGHHGEICQSVIGFNAVDVMNNEISGQDDPEMSLHNQPVFHDISLSVFVRMIWSENHAITTIKTSFLDSSMVGVYGLESVFSCNPVNVKTMNAKAFSDLSGRLTFGSHLLDCSDIKSLRSRSATNSVFLHPFPNALVTDAMFLRDLATGTKFVVFPFQLSGGDKEFTMSSHCWHSLTQYQQTVQEEKARDSQNLSERSGSGDKEPRDNSKRKSRQWGIKSPFNGGVSGLRLFQSMPGNENSENSVNTLTVNAEGNTEPSLRNQEGVTTMYGTRKGRYSLDSWETMRGSRNGYPPERVIKVTDCDTIPTIVISKYTKGMNINDWQDVDSPKVDMYINRATIFKFKMDSVRSPLWQ